jgi:hypothetical protein
MVFGLLTPTFTSLHLALSLIGMIVGAIVAVGLLSARHLEGWTLLFFVTTGLTSGTAYLFPSSGITSAQVVGAVSLAYLFAALIGLYGFRLPGWWIYVVTTLVAFYLNAFVGVAQAFQKLPLLQRLAPTQSESPFVVAQLVVMAIFIVAGMFAVIRFRPATMDDGLPPHGREEPAH